MRKFLPTTASLIFLNTILSRKKGVFPDFTKLSFCLKAISNNFFLDQLESDSLRLTALANRSNTAGTACISEGLRIFKSPEWPFLIEVEASVIVCGDEKPIIIPMLINDNLERNETIINLRINKKFQIFLNLR